MSIIFQAVKGSPLTAEEVDGNFQYLLNNTGNSGIINVGEHYFDGLELNMLPGWAWILFGTEFTTVSPFVHVAEDTSENNKRVDIACGNGDGAIIVISGATGMTEIDPSIPNNLVPLLRYVIEGETVVAMTEMLEGYITKLSERLHQIKVTDGYIIPISEDRRSFCIHNEVEDSSILGCERASGYNATLWSGSDIWIWNNSENDVILKNDSENPNVEFKFIFSETGGDFVLKPNSKAHFKYNVFNDTFEFFGSSLGGTSGDFIPLSGTEVGKPLTGEIEVDTLNSLEGFVGFYSNHNGIERRIAITDDGFSTIQNISDGSQTYIEQSESYNSLVSRDSNTNENSQIENTPQSTKITTTDADDNKAEIVVDGNGTVRFNSDIPSDGLSRTIYFNAEEGMVGDEEFDKQGDRKAFAQIADLEDALTADNIDYDNTSSGLLAETVQESVDELSAKKEDRVSVIPITENTTISALHHGKILLITADVTITFPTGLGAGFTGCAFRIATGGKMTPAFANGVTRAGFFADYNRGESLYVFKESNSTNIFYAV